MPTNILMPALSPTMSEGNLAKWHVKVGDEVHAGDVVAEIETDKATMEVEAVDEGRIGKIVVPEGTEGVQVNSVIAVLLDEGEDDSAIGEVAAARKPAPAPAAEAPAKAAPAAAPVESKPAAPAASPTPAAKPTSNGAVGRIFASPLARRIAKERGVDLASVSGSGPRGRIVKADVDGAKAGAPAAGAAAASAPVARSMSDEQIRQLYRPDSYEIVPHDNMRKIIARRLVEAKQSIPHFYLTVDTRIDKLLQLRVELNDLAPRDKDGNPEWKVSVNDLVIKALAKALVAVPEANATWTEGGMLRHKHADIGVAVAIPNGLITPVVRHADRKSVAEIANEMKDLAKRARERKLKPEEYQGGSTAVSNLGMFGIKEFSAVINPPHSSILAVGAGIETPVVRDGKVEVATVMQATLSTDHRAVDGALGAELLTAFKRFVEKPAALLL